MIRNRSFFHFLHFPEPVFLVPFLCLADLEASHISLVNLQSSSYTVCITSLLAHHQIHLGCTLLSPKPSIISSLRPHARQLASLPLPPLSHIPSTIFVSGIDSSYVGILPVTSTLRFWPGLQRHLCNLASHLSPIPIITNTASF